MLTKFVLTYFDGDGCPSVWFDAGEELNQYIKKEGIDEFDVIEIVEVEVIRTIKHLTMEERDKELFKRMEAYCDGCSDYGKDNYYPCQKYCSE